MLVDTRPAVLFAFAGELAETGCQVTPASGVDQAMEIGEREAFDLLLCSVPLDFSEPAMLLRFLRRSRRLRELRLVIKDSCQGVGVRLTDIAGEPTYSVCENLPIHVLGCVIKHARSLPSARSKFSSGIAPAVSMPPHFSLGRIKSSSSRAN
jgi:hypothetical protein